LWHLLFLVPIAEVIFIFVVAVIPRMLLPLGFGF
jgi:hypothetical protein